MIIVVTVLVNNITLFLAASVLISGALGFAVGRWWLLALLVPVYVADLQLTSTTLEGVSETEAALTTVSVVGLGLFVGLATRKLVGQLRSR